MLVQADVDVVLGADTEMPGHANQKVRSDAVHNAPTSAKAHVLDITLSTIAARVDAHNVDEKRLSA
ncbi:MAG: hypothetical protein ACREPY_04185 [Rhodanobacteraceae bacterium]